LSKPGEIVSDQKFRAYALSKGMLFQIQKPVIAQYDFLVWHTEQAIRETSLGVVSQESIGFFSNRVLRQFFSKVEHGEDAEVKKQIEGMVAGWLEKNVQPADSVFLREVFLPFLGRCKQRDLRVLGSGGWLDKKLLGVDSVGENKSEAKQV
jgi:hypothetical protein